MAVHGHISAYKEAKKRETGGQAISSGGSIANMAHMLPLTFIRENRVMWPHLVAREAGKCSLWILQHGRSFLLFKGGRMYTRERLATSALVFWGKKYEESQPQVSIDCIAT